MNRPHGMTSLLAAFLVLCASAGARAGQIAPHARWVGSWASSQQIPEARNTLDPDDLRDATLRQVVHLTLGGNQLRVRLSNAFGTEPLHIDEVHIARVTSPLTGGIDASTDKAVTFSGNPDVTIPSGTDYLSDPVPFPVAPLSNLAISLHMETPPAQQTSHPGARETSFLVHGNLVSAAELPGAKMVDHWFQLSGVNVVAPAAAGAIVTLGDSITDGRGSTTNGNDRWPDDLAGRLQASPATRAMAVLNVGTGGNRLLQDGLGPNAVSRLDRDVLAQAGVRALIVFEGINDLGTLTVDGDVPQAEHDALVRNMIGAYEQIILRAHAHDIRVIGATITPDMGYASYHPSAANESDRQAVNQWIRTSHRFDAVVDFDKVVRDPKNPDHLSPPYDSGDHLHPNSAAYRAMADAIPLSLFVAQRAPAKAPSVRISRTARSK